MHQPSRQMRTPGVLAGYRAYCVFMALLYFALVGVGIFLLAADGTLLNDLDMSSFEATLTAIVTIVICAPLMVGFGAGLFVPRTKFGWTVGLVLICIGLTSACCMIVCVPLLFYWLKRETKAFFNVT